MSDIRFVMIGIVVITVGFIILGVYGSEYTGITVETDEFSTCYEYSEEEKPQEIDCQEILQSCSYQQLNNIGLLYSLSVFYLLNH